MTPAEYTTFLATCDYSNPASIQALINNEYTSQAFQEEIDTKMVDNPSSITNVFSRMWSVSTFPDGIGDNIMSTVYTPPRFGTGFNTFQYDDEFCDVDRNDITRCFWCYEDIKSGGVEHLKTTLVRRGAKTEPLCLETFRSRAHFNDWVGRHLQDRFYWQDQASSDFYALALMRTAGHKILLEVGHPRANLELESPLPEFPSTYMKDFFIKPFNPDNIVGLSTTLLIILAQQMQQREMFRGAQVSTGRNGEPIYDAFIDSDAEYSLFLQNPDWREDMKYTMPEKLFRGYNAGTESDQPRNVILNFAFRTMVRLPRFAINDATGGIVPVQPTIDVNTENGTKPVPNPDWNVAPLGIMVIPSPNQAEILGRPGISIPGVPLTMLEGINEWVYWNKYDKECNPDENIFHHRYRWQKGWAPKRPYEALIIMYRRTSLTSYLTNTCNALPIIRVDSLSPCVDESFLEGGCNFAGRRAVEADVTEPLEDAARVMCSASTCGSETLLKLKVPFVNGRVGGVIPAVCGDLVLLNLSDGTSITGTLVDNSMAGTQSGGAGIYYVEIALALDEDQCVESIQSVDATPNAANIVGCIGDDDDDTLDPGEVRIVISGGALYNLELADTMTITFNDLTTAPATVTAMDHASLTYTIQFTDDTLTCGSNTGLKSLTFTP